MLAGSFLRQARGERTSHAVAGGGPELRTTRLARQCPRTAERDGARGGDGRSGAVSAALLRGLIEDAPVAAGNFTASHEEERVRKALEDCGGRVTRAARSLGISWATLWRRMRRMRQEH